MIEDNELIDLIELEMKVFAKTFAEEMDQHILADIIKQAEYETNILPDELFEI